MGQTILSFQNQKSGSAGVQATASGLTLEDLAIEDTKGEMHSRLRNDAIKQH